LNYRTFKAFYKEYVQVHLRTAFPGLVSYPLFAALKRRALGPLSFSVQSEWSLKWDFVYRFHTAVSLSQLSYPPAQDVYWTGSTLNDIDGPVLWFQATSGGH
jgi:hypothetical protein